MATSTTVTGTAASGSGDGYTFSELKVEVQTLLGKYGDTTRITTTRCGRWLNDAQRAIVRAYPGLRDVHKRDTTSVTCVANQYRYDLSTLITTYPVCHVLGVRYIDRQVSAETFYGDGLDDLTPGGTYTGSEKTPSYRVQIDGAGTPDTFKWSNDGGTTWEAETVSVTGSAQTLENGVTVTFAATTGHTADEYWDLTINSDYGDVDPYEGDNADLDRILPYIPQWGTGQPATYVYRGKVLEVWPMPGSTEAGAKLWLEYSRLPALMTEDGDYPALTDFDQPLIHWAAGLGMRFIKKIEEARESEAYARQLAEERVGGEADVDSVDQMMNYGP